MKENNRINWKKLIKPCIFAAVILSLTAVRKYKKGTISQKGSFMLQITAIILFVVAVLIGIFTKPNV